MDKYVNSQLLPNVLKSLRIMKMLDEIVLSLPESGSIGYYKR